MYDYLLRAFISLCILPRGLTTEDCTKSVLAKRNTVYAPEGGSLSLSCDIQACGDTWTANWTQTYSDKEGKAFIRNSDRHSVTNVTLSANTTRLFLHFLSVNQSDEGFFGCSVEWGQGITGQGHYVYVNVTAAVFTKRTLLTRFLVCATACIFVVVILLVARCLMSEVRPQPLPRTRSTSAHSPQNPPPPLPVPKKRTTVSYKAPVRSEQRTEVVYADISQDALRHQEVVRESDPSTVYSSVRFSGKPHAEDQFISSSPEASRVQDGILGTF